MSNNVAFTNLDGSCNTTNSQPPLRTQQSDQFASIPQKSAIPTMNSYPSNLAGEYLHKNPQKSQYQKQTQSNVKNHYQSVVVTPYEDLGDMSNTKQGTFHSENTVSSRGKNLGDEYTNSSDEDEDIEEYEIDSSHDSQRQVSTGTKGSKAESSAIVVKSGQQSQLSNPNMSREIVQHQPQHHGSAMIVPSPPGHEKDTFVDITPFLNQPQCAAAKKIGIPTSTLSKRWKEAVRQRKWPFRMVSKIDKEITTILHNLPQGPNAQPLSEETQEALALLLRRRQEELRPVIIRL